MKQVFFVVSALLALVALGYVAGAQAIGPGTVGNFAFRIHLDRDEDRVVLVCTEGCAWRDLAFDCGPTDPCSAEINEPGTVGDVDIRIHLDRDNDRMVLACGEGCAWRSLTFDCGPMDPCSAEVDERGSVTPARPVHGR